jgi:hypothetical protein
MRLEKRREQELAKRKGNTGRTIAIVIWLGISFVIAYFLTRMLFDQGYISYQIMYNEMYIPRAVPEWGLQFLIMFIIVSVMQMLFYVAYFIASPEGQQRTGDPTLKSRNKDPFDDR